MSGQDSQAATGQRGAKKKKTDHGFDGDVGAVQAAGDNVHAAWVGQHTAHTMLVGGCVGGCS